MSVGMSKKVYHEMVKEMSIIASWGESQKQRASNIFNHCFIFNVHRVYLSHKILVSNCCESSINETKMAHFQCIIRDDKEKKVDHKVCEYLLFA